MNAIHEGVLNNVEYAKLPLFNLNYPTSIPGVDPNILNPENTWVNKEEYKLYSNKVAHMFKKNFARFEHEASDTVKSGAPVIE